MSNIHAHARAREAAEAWLAYRKLAMPTPPRVGAAFAEQAMADAFAAGWVTATAPATGAEVSAIIASLIRDAQSAGTDEAADDAAQRIEAYLGAIHREEQDQWAVERATGQRQLDDAGSLMRETAELLRGYEAHHQGKVDRLVASGARDPDTEAAVDDARSKTRRNALAAARLEAWLGGADRYPVRLADVPGEDSAVAHGQAINPAEVLRDIAEGMVDGETIKGVDHASFDQVADQLARPVPWRKEGVADLVAVRLNTGDPRFDPALPATINGYLYVPAKENDHG